MEEGNPIAIILSVISVKNLRINSIRNTCQVKVKTISVVSAFLLAHQRADYACHFKGTNNANLGILVTFKRIIDQFKHVNEHNQYLIAQHVTHNDKKTALFNRNEVFEKFFVNQSMRTLWSFQM